MRWLLAVGAAALVLGPACSAQVPAERIVIGAIYPLSGPQASGGREELGGVRSALDLARRQGVTNAGRIELRVVDAPTPDQAVAAVDRLVDEDHAEAIIGTYGSSLSVPAAARADQRRVVYWETGAIADQVTDHRRWVFRTVATGSTLGRMAAQFTARVLIPQAGILPGQARVVIVHTEDFYGVSVAAGETAEARVQGITQVTSIGYDPHSYDPVQIAAQVAAARPDYFWDVSYLDDGVAVYQAVLATKVGLRAAVGTSSAFCMPEFGRRLGSQAAGVYAADKPDESGVLNALSADARALLAQASQRFMAANHGQPMEIPGVAGFVGGWALFHDVLPGLSDPVTPEAIRKAAIAVDVPVGAAINGGGILFAAPGLADAGQNRRASAVIGQWQPGGEMKIVWPAAFASAP
ncbi:MAG: hypothetical protein NVS9B1_19750 [Candidatus Dormibacteraceae bacterium]